MKQDLLSLYNGDTPGRLLKTFVFLEKEGKKELFWCNALEETTFWFYACPNIDKLVLERKTLKEGQVFLETFLPAAGWYQVDGSASYITGRPSRQWKRSLCNATHTAFSPWGMFRFTTDYAKWVALLDKEQPSFSLDEAHQNITQKEYVCCRLSTLFAVTHKGDIFNNTIQVGKVDWAKKTYKINPLFKDEWAAITTSSTFKDVS